MVSANFPILSFLVWLPVVLAITFTFYHGFSIRIIVCISSVVIFFISCFLLFQQKYLTQDWSFLEYRKFFFFNYHFGIDAISAILICLSSFIIMICIIYACFAVNISVSNIVMLLLIESFTAGVFLSLDLLLFYIFFEASLIPVFIIVGTGNDSGSINASLKMFLYKISGSLLALFAIIYLYFGCGVSSIDSLYSKIVILEPKIKFYLWIALFVAFAIKVPMLPFHMWLPDAHTNAPTIGSVVLAAVMLKIGAYGMLRFIVPFFDDVNQFVANYIIVLSIFSVIYGALVAFAQKDVKRIIAYSSISHMGFVTIGLFSGNINAIIGAIFQMVAHGITSAALFFCIGILKNKTHDKLLDNYSGVATIAPKLSVFFLLFTFSSIGVPGTVGFISEFLIVLGLGKERIIMAALLSFGFIFGAIYMLNLYKKVFTGNLHISCVDCSDISKIEILLLLPLATVVLFLGIYPNFFLMLLKNCVEHKLLFVTN